MGFWVLLDGSVSLGGEGGKKRRSILKNRFVCCAQTHIHTQKRNKKGNIKCHLQCNPNIIKVLP